jgi:hypothetical protein
MYLAVISAKANACGRSFAVLSAQVSTVGLRLRHSRLACGSMFEVSRYAVAAGEEQLVSFTAEQSKYCFIFTERNPWPFRRFTFHELGSLVVSSRRR